MVASIVLARATRAGSFFLEGRSALQPNRTKGKLKSGQTVFGCFVRYPNACLVEMLAYQGWDFLVFDGEHGTLEPRQCEHMVRAAELRDVTALVRVPTNSPPVILRFLDVGAQGILVPHVDSAAEAEAAVRSSKYYPSGNRGLATPRAAHYGLTMTLDRYVEQANRETLVVLYIESMEAVRHLPEILAVEGVDVVNIARTDLSQSLGVPGKRKHPKVEEATEAAVEAVTKSDVALGIMASSAEAAREWQDRGARYISFGFEPLLSRASREFLQAARAE